MSSVKTAETGQPIDALLGNRWSHRSFDADRPLERQKLLSVLEAARWAPSCFNQQPWRYVVCDRQVADDSWNRALDSLVPGNRRWAKRAPVLILAVSDQAAPLYNGEKNCWADYDTGAASENLCLQASALGLAVHQMAGFDRAMVREAFRIPEGFNPLAMIALGYPARADALEGWQLEEELAPRSRKAPAQIFFAGSWNKPLHDQ